MRYLLLCLVANPVVADQFPVSRCVNFDQALEAPFEGDWGYVIAQDDIVWIADQGFDTIRLPVKFSNHWDSGLAPAILARVDQVIGWAFAEDLQVILDLHHFDGILADPDMHADMFFDIWAELSTHYAGYDDRLIFELLNEPSENLKTPQAVALFENVYPTIRADHPNRWIILEGSEWAEISALQDLPLIDDRTALSFHYYAPFSFTHQLAEWHVDPMPAATWGDAVDRQVLSNDIALAASRGLPLLLGEFGVTAPTVLSERINWIAAVREEVESHGIGWCHWGFASGFAIYDMETKDWLPGMQQALMSKQ